MTRTQQHRRVRRLEQHAQRTHQSFEVWISGENDEDMLGPNGEGMSVAEFKERYPDAINIGVINDTYTNTDQ